MNERLDRTSRGNWSGEAQQFLSELVRAQAEEIADRAEKIASIRNKDLVTAADVIEARDFLFDRNPRTLVSTWRNLARSYRTSLITAGIAALSVAAAIAVNFITDVNGSNVAGSAAAISAAVAALIAAAYQVTEAARSARRSEETARAAVAEVSQVDLKLHFLSEWMNLERGIREWIRARTGSDLQGQPLRKLLSEFESRAGLSSQESSTLAYLLNLRNMTAHATKMQLSADEYADAIKGVRALLRRLETGGEHRSRD